MKADQSPETLASPTLCALPFSHLFLGEDGKSYPCCFGLESHSPNRDEEGNIVRAAGQGLEAIWNSAGQRKVRRQMLAGEEPESCRRCFSLERHGLPSRRQDVNRQFREELPRAVAKVSPEGEMPLELASIDLRPGNLCNLRCQMCSPVSSRLMKKDFAQLYPGSALPLDEHFEWHRDPRLLAEILRCGGELREAHFAGGEPFLIPEVAALVEELSRKPFAKMIRLSFNSNATVLPEKLLALFPRFGSVRLLLSLDGLGPVNDYIRFPSRFPRIRENLERLHARRQEWNLTEVMFITTVQLHNIFHLPELIRFLPRKFPGFLPFPATAPLRYPECLSVRVLPAAAKRVAADQLLELIREEEPYWREIEARDPLPSAAERFGQQLKGLASFMLSEDHTHLLPEFRRFNAVIEGLRGAALPVPGLELGR